MKRTAFIVGYFGMLGGITAEGSGDTTLLSLQGLLGEYSDDITVELIIYGFEPIYDPIAQFTYYVVTPIPSMVAQSIASFMIMAYVLYRLKKDLLGKPPKS